MAVSYDLCCAGRVAAVAPFAGVGERCVVLSRFGARVNPGDVRASLTDVGGK